MNIKFRSDKMTIEGYVNAVDRYSKPLNDANGKFIEKIAPETFNKALRKNKNTPMLINHNKGKVVANTEDGTLELVEDNIGLKAKATITDPKVIEEVRSGNVQGWSFGFNQPVDTWKDGEEVRKRTITDLNLTEVSLLTIEPAYIGTSVEVRANEHEEIRCNGSAISIDEDIQEEEIEEQRSSNDLKDGQILELDIWLMKNK